MIAEYAHYEHLLSIATLVSAMFGLGLMLTAGDFIRVFRAPQGILLILAVQVLLSPLLAILVARVFMVPPPVTVGLLVCMALPGGLFSNILTHLGRGNVALSISATAVCSLACLVTSTMILKVYGAAELPSGFALPVWSILQEISFYLLLPLALGMMVHRLVPRRAPLVANICLRTSMLLLALIVILAAAAGRVDITAYGWRSLFAIIALQIGLLWITLWLCRFLRFTSDNAIAIVIEVVLRNSHLGLLLKASLLPASEASTLAISDGVLFAVLVYGTISMIVCCAEVIGKRRGIGLYAVMDRQTAESVAAKLDS